MAIFSASISLSISSALLCAVDKLLTSSLLIIFSLFQFVPLMHPECNTVCFNILWIDYLLTIPVMHNEKNLNLC